LRGSFIAYIVLSCCLRHMKKILLTVGIGLGILNFARAIDITLVSGGSISGANAYEYRINLTPGTQIATASLTFNTITLTSGGTDISYDLINRSDATQAIYDGDVSGDYFQSHSPYSSSTVALGVRTFISPHYAWVGGHYTLVYDTESWTYTFSAIALANLQADALNGLFDIGIDPDCIYNVGSIVFSYTTSSVTHNTVPEVPATAGLLGISVMGLFAARRRFCRA